MSTASKRPDLVVRPSGWSGAELNRLFVAVASTAFVVASTGARLLHHVDESTLSGFGLSIEGLIKGRPAAIDECPLGFTQVEPDERRVNHRVFVELFELALNVIPRIDPGQPPKRPGDVPIVAAGEDAQSKGKENPTSIPPRKRRQAGEVPRAGDGE